MDTDMGTDTNSNTSADIDTAMDMEMKNGSSIDAKLRF
jgi:hypothetical protein